MLENFAATYSCMWQLHRPTQNKPPPTAPDNDTLDKQRSILPLFLSNKKADAWPIPSCPPHGLSSPPGELTKLKLDAPLEIGATHDTPLESNMLFTTRTCGSS